jgi:hypothetical protein
MIEKNTMENALKLFLSGVTVPPAMFFMPLVPVREK